MKKVFLFFLALTLFLSCKKNISENSIEEIKSSDLKIELCKEDNVNSFRGANGVTNLTRVLYHGNYLMKYTLDSVPTVWFQFNGDSITNPEWTYYNSNQSYYMGGSGLGKWQKDTIMRIVAQYYLYDASSRVNFTFTKSDFDATVNHNRLKVMIGERASWWSGYAGVAMRNSFYYTTNVVPVLCFSAPMNGNLDWNAKNIAHEIGHGIGLPHQSDYNSSCGIINHYSSCKIMGGLWTDSSWTWYTSTGCFPQNDYDTITRAFPGFVTPLK